MFRLPKSCAGGRKPPERAPPAARYTRKKPTARRKNGFEPENDGSRTGDELLRGVEPKTHYTTRRLAKRCARPVSRAGRAAEGVNSRASEKTTSREHSLAEETRQHREPEDARRLRGMDTRCEPSRNGRPRPGTKTPSGRDRRGREAEAPWELRHRGTRREGNTVGSAPPRASGLPDAGKRNHRGHVKEVLRDHRQPTKSATAMNAAKKPSRDAARGVETHKSTRSRSPIDSRGRGRRSRGAD